MPTYLEQLIAQGNHLLETGAILKATAIFQEAYKIDSQHRGVLLGSAACSYRRDDFDGALDYLHRALALNGNDTEVCQQIGSLLYFQRRFEDAADAFREVLSIDSNEINAAGFWGISLIWVDELEEAKRILEGVLNRDSSNLEARVGMAMLEAKNGNGEKFAQQFGTLLTDEFEQSPRQGQYIWSLLAVPPRRASPET
jgi:tetratricopeptide (TPR) repeat protein